MTIFSLLVVETVLVVLCFLGESVFDDVGRLFLLVESDDDWSLCLGLFSLSLVWFCCCVGTLFIDRFPIFSNNSFTLSFFFLFSLYLLSDSDEIDEVWFSLMVVGYEFCLGVLLTIDDHDT